MNIDDQLRRLDPAREVPESLGRSVRAAATLARVTATEPATGPTTVKRTARYALAAVVASAGVLLAPILGTGGGAAFATWDAGSRPVTPQEAAHYAQECARWTKLPVGYEPKVIEVRGTWVMTYLASADGEAQCLRSMEPSPGFVDGENESVSGPLVRTPAADALATTGVLETSGGIVSSTHFMVAGKAGSRVTGVVFLAQDMRVRATVQNGSFTAWWPQRKPANLYGRLIDNTGFNGSPNPDVEVTLSDGRTITKQIKEYDVNH